MPLEDTTVNRNYTVDLVSEGVAVGDSTCFRVRAYDPAGNRGDWSETVTLTRRASQGYCDMVDCGGCSAASRTDVPLLLSLTFAVFVVRRRR